MLLMVTENTVVALIICFIVIIISILLGNKIAFPDRTYGKEPQIQPHKKATKRLKCGWGYP